jgi:hypothetical protein
MGLIAAVIVKDLGFSIVLMCQIYWSFWRVIIRQGGVPRRWNVLLSFRTRGA